MLADNGFEYGIDFSQQQQYQQHQRSTTTAEEETPKSKPQIITKDLTLSPTKQNNYNNNYKDNQYDDVDGQAVDDVDGDVDVADADADDAKVPGNTNDMVAQTNAVLNADNVAIDGTGMEEEGQSTLHLPHARWPNHWSDVNTQLSESSSAVTYKWLTSPWSECSQKCGAAGSGLRVSTCLLPVLPRSFSHATNTSF